MAIEETLYLALSGDSNIIAIVSDRIYSDIRDQGDLNQSIFFERNNTEFLRYISSFSPYGEKTSFSITCFESTREKTETLSLLIINALSVAGFICTDKQSLFDDGLELYSTVIQTDFTLTY